MVCDKDHSDDAATPRLIVIALMEERESGYNFQLSYKDLCAMQDNYRLNLVETDPASLLSRFDISIEEIPKKVMCDVCEGHGEVDA